MFSERRSCRAADPVFFRYFVYCRSDEDRCTRHVLDNSKLMISNLADVIREIVVHDVENARRAPAAVWYPSSRGETAVVLGISS